jgi:hypothetical protein
MSWAGRHIDCAAVVGLVQVIEKVFALMGRDFECARGSMAYAATLTPSRQPSPLPSYHPAASGLFADLKTRIRQGIPRADSAVAVQRFSARAGRVIAGRANVAVRLSDTRGGP